jgi:molecular chaperone HtpG
MRFVKGVLESDDISLNISRETIQSNVRILKMKDLLAKKFIRELTSIKDDDSEKYRKFWDEFGDFVKEGIISDQIRQKKLQNLLLFTTSKTKDDERIGLKEYLERMKEDQDEIYYLVGENLDLLRISPHLG